MDVRKKKKDGRVYEPGTQTEPTTVEQYRRIEPTILTIGGKSFNEDNMLIHDLRNSLFVHFIKPRGSSNSELRFPDIELRLCCRKILSPRPLF